ncbi:hypothetical protein [Halosolutus gelatinilyticus]|uniref:hypothetical protein n=1 Tax=Halosolutus gelatinilyticus TaxID=2931975 RepID=UPI001FF3E492|nr:hypothetical protein [Halosolutus gelatinilyticus]
MFWRSPPRRYDRRGVRYLTVGTAIVLLVVTAGCAGFLGGDDRDGVDGDPVAQVPANATTLVHLDAAALADGEGDRLLADLEAAEGDAADTAEMVRDLENRTGLDPLATTGLLRFELADGAGTGYVVETDRSEADVVAAIEDRTGVEYELTAASGADVLYEPVDADGNAEPAFVGVHGDGRYVVGDEAAVRASLDVRYGEADAISGPVRDAYDDAVADGAALTVASEPSGSIVPTEYEALIPLDFDVFGEVVATSRRYDAADEGIAVDVGLSVEDESDAAELEEVVRGAIGYLIENPLTDETVADALETVAVDREGTTVTLAYEGDVDAVLALFEEV